MTATAKHTKANPNRIVLLLGSRFFFWTIVIVFVLEATWIALSARYPQAFDEQFHFGIIQLYAHHLSPFLTQQPPDSGQFGAVFRDPSYLYHYLMSFPYRLLTHLTSSQTTQIIILRLMNVLMLASSLPIFKKVLRLVPVSEAMANTVLAFMVLLPVFPLLGSQISYDNLFIPLSAFAIYWSLKFILLLRNQHIWRWDHLLRLGILGLLTSLVKYPFLPIFLGIGICIALAWKQVRARGVHYVSVTGKRGKLRLACYGLALIISIGLFVQRDGINTLTYGTPIPECNQVLSVQECMAYGPWARNYRIAQHPVNFPVYQVIIYPFIWLYHMMGELVFTISSGFNAGGTVDYFTGAQLIIIEVVTWFILGVGLLLVLLHRRYIATQPILRVFMLISGVYILTLFLQNLRDYTHLGQPLAIHGRYLFPILPLLFVIVALAFGRTLERVKFAMPVISRKAGLATIFLVILILQGGGFVTYILRSDPSWFWPQSSPARRVNATAKKILKPVIIDTEPSD